MKTTITLILCTGGFASAQMITCPPDAVANVQLATNDSAVQAMGDAKLHRKQRFSELQGIDRIPDNSEIPSL